MKPGSALLGVAALGAAATANGFKAFARHGPLSVPSFTSGVTVSEAPLHQIALQAGAAVLLGRHGRWRTARGALGLAVNAASWAGLVGLHRQALHSNGAFETALRETFGDAYRPSPAPRFDVKALALPHAGHRKHYLVADKVPYGPHGVRNQLEIWRRPDLPADGSAPVVMQIHGGAWSIGHKAEQARPTMGHLAHRGYVVVSINYRLSPKATFPDHIVDVKRALAWVRENIHLHGGDPSWIAVTGGSAGGHLSALAALSANDPAFQPGFEDADTTVQAAAPMYGQYDLANRTSAANSDTTEFFAKVVMKATVAAAPERWAAASPIERVHADAPPFLVTHGTNDALLPVEQAREFVGALRRVSSAPVAYVELALTQHAYDLLATPRTLYTTRAMADFFDAVRATPAAVPALS